MLVKDFQTKIASLPNDSAEYQLYLAEPDTIDGPAVDVELVPVIKVSWTRKKDFATISGGGRFRRGHSADSGRCDRRDSHGSGRCAGCDTLGRGAARAAGDEELPGVFQRRARHRSGTEILRDLAAGEAPERVSGPGSAGVTALLWRH